MTDKKYNDLANDTTLSATISSLTKNGITAFVVENKEEALTKLLSLIPEGSEVMDMTSVTLATLGAVDTLNSEKYNSVKVALGKMNRGSDQLVMQKMGAAPEYAVGSVHAVTEDGLVVVASNTGSQLPAYAYGATNVIWVVGIQKITKNLDEAMSRIYDYVLPLESDRAHKAYGVEGSNVSKLLIINKEVNPDRIKIIFVKEELGF